MGIAERKEREKERRRNEIIDAAEKVFFTKGIHHSTMDDVAEKAELSKGTLYLYFKSKEDLFHSINLRGLQILQKMFETAFQKQKLGIEKLIRIGRAYFEFAQKHSDYFNSMVHCVSHEMEHNEKDEAMMACHNAGQEVIRIVANAVKIGLEDRSIKTQMEPMKLAVLLWGQTTGVIQIIVSQQKHIKDGFQMNPDELISGYFEFMRSSLENKR